MDALFERIGTNDWSRRHGKDWTFADTSRSRLTYFDAATSHAPLESPVIRGHRRMWLSGIPAPYGSTTGAT
jgi:hypothetical protein